MKAQDNKMGAYYNYDASGERNFKLTGDIIELTQNGVPYNYAFLESPTLYASGLITLNERGYTKHYFEEGKRICSKIGGGFRYAGYDIMEPIGLITSFEEQLGNAKEGIFNTFDQCIKSPVDLENTQDKIVKVMKEHEKDRNEEEYQFYYTNDHLGSSTYITNQDGKITQTLAYLPYGELRSNREYLNVKNQNSHEQHWVDLDNHPPYITPYKFNGKEKDQETGYNYFGARYYNDKLSIWLSVDPLSDKYPHLTSYNYCANNPVMLIDPDGRDVETADEQSRNNIKNTLTKKEAKYVRFDENGKLDKNRLNKSKSTSENMTALKELANSKRTYVFSTATEYLGENELVGDNDNGTKGISLIPGAETDSSPDDKVYIITSSKLSEQKQASNTAHEGYGHAYFYELQQQGHNVNPYHQYEAVLLGTEWDNEYKTEVPIIGRKETNIKLDKQIKKVENQAIINYNSRKKK